MGKIVFQLIGGVASTTICYFVPAMLYLRLFRHEKGIKWYPRPRNAWPDVFFQGFFVLKQALT